jgi:hypothetical protein
MREVDMGLKVSATPIDFPAILALPEFPESLEDVRVNLASDDGFVDRVNPAVAIKAAGQRLIPITVWPAVPHNGKTSN